MLAYHHACGCALQGGRTALMLAVEAENVGMHGVYVFTHVPHFVRCRVGAQP